MSSRVGCRAALSGYRACLPATHCTRPAPRCLPRKASCPRSLEGSPRPFGSPAARVRPCAPR
eukprot:10296376-Alexandrium_andersonii.AAC.1